MKSYKVEIIIENKVYYRLLEELKLLEYTVPTGFVTDGASTPRILWALFPPVDEYFPAAVIHDYLLTTGARQDADKAFLLCLKELKINWLTRNLMYASVKLYSKSKTIQRWA
jgi:hypothetical protein